MRQPSDIPTKIIGVVVFLAVLAAWLYGEERGVDTEILWITATPVIMALAVGQGLANTANAAKQAADQTNGTLEARIQASLTSALAARDAARTRQAAGDIATPTHKPERSAP